MILVLVVLLVPGVPTGAILLFNGFCMTLLDEFEFIKFSLLILLLLFGFIAVGVVAIVVAVVGGVFGVVVVVAEGDVRFGSILIVAISGVDEAEEVEAFGVVVVVVVEVVVVVVVSLMLLFDGATTLLVNSGVFAGAGDIIAFTD